MDIKKYKKIADKAVKLLNSNFSSDTTVAISSLNLIKHHPEYIKKIKYLSLIDFFQIFIINIFRFFYSFIRSLFENN